MQAGLRALAVAVLVALFATTACDVDTATEEDLADAEQDDLVAAEVVRVVDGDTIIVNVDGREERLRYIGIDAPESVTPDQPVECFGPEAAEENARLVEGRTVYLEEDVESRDRFGRMLRYVYIEGPDGGLSLVNVRLIEGGYVEAGSYPPNDRYSDEFFAAERQAREDGLGLWTAC